MKLDQLSAGKSSGEASRVDSTLPARSLARTAEKGNSFPSERPMVASQPYRSLGWKL